MQNPLYLFDSLYRNFSVFRPNFFNCQISKHSLTQELCAKQYNGENLQEWFLTSSFDFLLIVSMKLSKLWIRNKKWKFSLGFVCDANYTLRKVYQTGLTDCWLIVGAYCPSAKDKLSRILSSIYWFPLFFQLFFFADGAKVFAHFWIHCNSFDRTPVWQGLKTGKKSEYIFRFHFCTCNDDNTSFSDILGSVLKISHLNLFHPISPCCLIFLH